MATTVSKGTKSALVALAVFLLGMGMTFLQEKNIAVAVILFGLTAIVAFFAFIVEVPAKDLPPQLQDLQKQLDSATGLPDLVSLFKKYQTQIEAFVSTLSAGGSITTILQMLGKYSPQLETIVTSMITQLEKSNVSLDKVDWQQLITTALKSIPTKS
jgi:hypothetical protein